MGRNSSRRLVVVVVLLVVCSCLCFFTAGSLVLVGQRNSSLPVAIAPLDTATPYPTATSYFTATPYPTDTPYPSSTPYPTYTPYPSSTPYPTHTLSPTPTRTSTPAVTPTPRRPPTGVLKGCSVLRSSDANQLLVNNNRSRDWFYGDIHLIVNTDGSRDWFNGNNQLIVNNNGSLDWTSDSDNLLVVNNNGSRDAVVALAPVSLLQTNAVVAVYVRARDQFTCNGINEGTYYTYVTQGEDWDSAQGRFTRADSYSRFTDAATYPSYWDYCKFTRVTVTLGGGMTSAPSVSVYRGVYSDLCGGDDTTSSPSVTVSPSQFPSLK